jgi:response regulator RpfG family c-di-GMP phosphodiesterase
MTNQQEKVLIVDDEITIRKLLKQKLSREGYDCRETESVEAALARLAEKPADAIILDVRMPGKSGIELLPALKSRYPDTAVIMATAVTDTSLAIECMRNGADDYICKPFNLEEVTVSMQRALEKKQLQSQIKQYQSKLENKFEEQTGEVRRLFLGAIEALVSTLEAKDRYTAGHSRRVAEIAVNIGTELDLPDDSIDDLHWGGLLHDVGKIAVDQIIQNKPGRLTQEEYEHIMIHAHVGAGIVKPVVNDNVVEMIEHHHDHFDGHGLHQTIAGTEIPLAARILAVADAFEAMTSERPYRPAMSIEETINEMKRCVGSQFDPMVVTAFLKKIAVINRVD